jgi:Ca2+-binding RTX toxin-like protein
MTTHAKKITGIIVFSVLVCLSVSSLFVLSLLLNRSTEASTKEVIKPWVCPIDPRFNKEDCSYVMAHDPGYLSEEDARENAEPGSGEAGILHVPECELDTYNDRVLCEGGINNDTFLVGSYNGEFTVCASGNTYYQYDTDDFSRIDIYGYGGSDTIKVIMSGTETCWYGMFQHITMYPFNSKWLQYLRAYGGPGADSIYGTPNNDNLDGGADGDTIYGRGGQDYLYAGDTGSGQNFLYSGGCGSGESDFDRMYGSSLVDNMNCHGGESLLYSGKCIMVGYDGDDWYKANDSGSQMTDSTSYTTGNDFYGAAGIDTMYGDNGNDYMKGEAGTDTINGNGGADAIYGGSGGDTLNGGSGDDYIIGDGGSDTIAGGTGDDCIIGDFYYDDYLPDMGSDDIDGGGHVNGDCVYCDNVTFGTDCGDPTGSYGPEESGQPDNGDEVWNCSNAECDNTGACNSGEHGYCDIFH